MTKKLNVLTVDDDMINLKLLNVMLKKNSSIGEITEASNGLEALNILNRRYDIDLVLLDVVMPVMNGLEFLVNAQSNSTLSKIPVIILTTDETIKKEALEKGAYDFLTKPIREAELSQKIEAVANLIF